MGYRESQLEWPRELGQQWGNTSRTVGELQEVPGPRHGAVWQQMAKMWTRSARVHVDQLGFWSSGNGSFISLFIVLKWGRNLKIWGALQVCLC